MRVDPCTINNAAASAIHPMHKVNDIRLGKLGVTDQQVHNRTTSTVPPLVCLKPPHPFPILTGWVAFSLELVVVGLLDQVPCWNVTDGMVVFPDGAK